MSCERSPYSLDDRNMGSRFPSCKSSLQLKGKFQNDRNVSRKRPNDSNAGKNELVPKKRASGLGDNVSSSSGMHSWDALLQKRGNVQETKHADGCKGMPTQKKGSSPGECLNSHSSWPSWNSCLQDINADEATNSASDACRKSRSAAQSWNSWLQNRWGAKHSEDMPQERVSRSGDRVGSHYNKPPLRSRLGKRVDCEEDKALVDGGCKSSNRTSRWVSPGSQVKTTDRVTKDVSWKRSNNSSDHLHVPSKRIAWESELQIRNNAEGLKSTLEETTSKVIKSLKKNDSTRDRRHRRAESSADNARPDRRRSNLKNSCSVSEEMDDTKPLTQKSLQERSNSRDEANGLLQGGNSIIAAESHSELPTLNSDVQKRDDNKEATHGCRKEAAVHSSILPSRNLEGRGKRDGEDASDVHNKGVRICLDSQACTSFSSPISYREETNNIGEETDTLDLLAINKSDDERLSLGMASLEPRTTVETNGSSDGPLELTTSGWAAPEWKCSEQTQSNPTKRNDTSAERAINLIESAGFPSTGTSVVVEVVCNGNEQANDRSDEIPDISAELGSSWHSDEHNIQRRRILGDSNVSHTTKLQSILLSPNPQRSVSEEPKVVADELHLQEEGNVGEPNARGDDMTLNEIKDAAFPSARSCVNPTLQSSLSAEDINVLPREEAPSSVHDKDTKDTHGEKTFTSIDGSKFPHSEPVLELGVEGDIEEHAIGRVEGRLSVHIYQSTNQDPDMFGGLETIVADSACTNHPNSHTTTNSTSVLPKHSVRGEMQKNDLNMFHGSIVCPRNCPAKKCIWKGNFEVTDIASVVRVFEGFSAHPSFKVCRRAYDFSKKMPSTVEFLVHPQSKYWPMIFEDCPDTNDVALYFYPKNEQATHGYTSLLRFIDSKDLMLRSQMSDGVELLVFPSRLLDAKCQTIKNSYFFWGLFCIKRK